MILNCISVHVVDLAWNNNIVHVNLIMNLFELYCSNWSEHLKVYFLGSYSLINQHELLILSSLKINKFLILSILKDNSPLKFLFLTLIFLILHILKNCDNWRIVSSIRSIFVVLITRPIVIRTCIITPIVFFLFNLGGVLPIITPRMFMFMLLSDNSIQPDCITFMISISHMNIFLGNSTNVFDMLFITLVINIFEKLGRIIKLLYLTLCLRNLILVHLILRIPTVSCNTPNLPHN